MGIRKVHRRWAATGVEILARDPRGSSTRTNSGYFVGSSAVLVEACAPAYATRPSCCHDFLLDGQLVMHPGLGCRSPNRRPGTRRRSPGRASLRSMECGIQPEISPDPTQASSPSIREVLVTNRGVL